MTETYQGKKLGKQISKRIKRGRQIPISSLFEEGLAILIEKFTSDDIKILVDFPVCYRLKPKERAKTIYPDIVLIRKESLIGILEAKLDLGFLSPKWANKRKQVFKQLESKKEILLRGEQYPVLQKFKKACVVLHAGNHKERLPGFRENVENPIFLISENHPHPNETMNPEEIEAYIKKVQKDSDNQKQWKIFENLVLGFSKRQKVRKS